MLTAIIKDENGKILGVMELSPKVFKTGSRGYFGVTKAMSPVKGERLQVSMTATVIGSKPAN